MVDFSSITNDALRSLAMTSPALATLEDGEKQEMVGKFAAANEGDQAYYLSVFQTEKRDLTDLDQRWSQELADAAAQVDEASRELQKVQHDYDASVLKMLEARSQAEDEKHAEEILTQLQSL